MPIGLILASLAAPAAASIAASADPARIYVRARVAAMNGAHSDAAEMLSGLSSRRPGEAELRTKVLAEALGAGRMDLAIPAARAFKPEELAADARLLLVADAIKRGRTEDAKALLAVKGETGDLTFLTPLVDAWSAAARKDFAAATETIDQVNSNSLLGPFKAEMRTYLTLKSGNSADAEAYARRAIGNAGPRELKVRLSIADAFLAAGDRQRAGMMLDGIGADGFLPERRLRSGKSIGLRVETLDQALADVVAALAADVARRQRGARPTGLVQVARFLDPANSSATALLAILHETRERHDEALALLASVPANDPLISQIRDLQVQILSETDRFDAAQRIAGPAASASDASAADFARLGSLQSAMGQFAPAAASFQRAIDQVRATGPQTDLWTLQLLQAEALNRAGQWDAAKTALHAALAAQPDEPLILNYLGYAMLEKGENLDTAEALIRKASELAPDNASIIDSLGWTEFKRGKVNDAITTLQKAAAQDPEQAEIQEHLGDALFTSGRRYEARFAWTAGLLTAEDAIGRRLRAKLEQGLTPANAAP